MMMWKPILPSFFHCPQCLKGCLNGEIKLVINVGMESSSIMYQKPSRSIPIYRQLIDAEKPIMRRLVRSHKRVCSGVTRCFS